MYVMSYVRFFVNTGKPMIYWAIPGAIGGAWFVFPALTPDFKAKIGL